MRPRALLIIGFVLVALVGFLNWFGGEHSLFFKYYWYDTMMHYLGPVSIGFVFLWVWFVSGLFGWSTPTPKEAMVSVVAFVMMVAIGWEFFEFAYRLSYPAPDYFVDTFQDFLLGFLGAVTVGFVGRFKTFYE